MFKKIAESIKQAMTPAAPVDPKVFNDPLAERVDWQPCKHGGSNFCTHKMVRVNPTRIEFKLSVGAIVFCLVFLLVGLGVAIGVTWAQLAGGKSPLTLDVIMPLLIGLIFTLVGGGMLIAMGTPTVLDAKLGLYWKGRTDPRLASARNRLKICIDLSDIHAIQVLAERCQSSGGRHGSGGAYYSYELNFVLNDGSRVNVVDHGDGKRIRNEAHILADCLDVTVWDASQR